MNLKTIADCFTDFAVEVERLRKLIDTKNEHIKALEERVADLVDSTESAIYWKSMYYDVAKRNFDGEINGKC